MLHTVPDIALAEPVGVPTYRAYRLDRDGGIEGVDIVEARNDDDAKTLAARIANTNGVDLWERARFLESFPSLKASEPGAKG